MTSIKNVLVVGATGNLGPVVVQQLLAANFNVSVLSRLESTSTPPPNVKVIKSDFSPESLAEAFKNQDAIVSTVGPAGKRAQTKLIDAAVAAGIKRFIPSDFGFKTYDMSEIRRRVPALYQRLNGIGSEMILDYVKEAAAKNPGFAWTAMGGGLLFDWTSKIGFLGTSIPNHKTLIVDSGNESYLTVTIPQLARAVVKVLQQPEKTANKYLTVYSFVTTQNQVLTTAEKATGHKFEVTHTDADAMKKDGEELIGKGDIKGLGKLWGSFFWRDGEGGAKDVGDGNVVLGLPEEDLEEVIKGIAGI